MSWFAPVLMVVFVGLLGRDVWHRIPMERRVRTIYRVLRAFQWYRRLVYVLGAGVILFAVSR